MEKEPFSQNFLIKFFQKTKDKIFLRKLILCGAVGGTIALLLFLLNPVAKINDQYIFRFRANSKTDVDRIAWEEFMEEEASSLGLDTKEIKKEATNERMPFEVHLFERCLEEKYDLDKKKEDILKKTPTTCAASAFASIIEAKDEAEALYFCERAKKASKGTDYEKISKEFGREDTVFTGVPTYYSKEALTEKLWESLFKTEEGSCLIHKEREKIFACKLISKEEEQTLDTKALSLPVELKAKRDLSDIYDRELNKAFSEEVEIEYFID